MYVYVRCVYISSEVGSFNIFQCFAGIHPKDSFVMLRAIVLISSVWHLSYGQQQLLLLFTVLLLDIKQMLKIWRPCFTCMYGVRVMWLSRILFYLLLLYQNFTSSTVPTLIYCFLLKKKKKIAPTGSVRKIHLLNMALEKIY